MHSGSAKTSDATAKLKHQPNEDLPPSQNMWRKAARRIRRDRSTLAAMTVVLVFALASLLAQFLSETVLQVDPEEIDLNNKYLPLFAEGHPLGADELGRDHLSRLLYGGRVSLGIAFFTAIFSISIGITVGVFAGFYSGIIDDFIMWIVTTLNSIPGLFLLITFNTVLSPTPATLVFILSFIGWTGVARLVRGETLSLKQSEYNIAARAIGASSLRIMFVHIVPNVFSLLIIVLAQAMSGLILIEAALSYIGFGIQPPIPSWGNMLSNSVDYMRRAQHLVFLPGLLITLTVFCFYLIGDGLRDAFDPKIAD
ncbi:MAG: ABC transporter permease [Chloroflexota bacterium]|nr:ABC transporter permease [Chloroflexota bacterium]MDE2853679.1 ABC transporter permease [Chloroflexota bacterium]MDE2948356.1 ABC transporter permease [Chloroflexota bacterium]